MALVVIPPVAQANDDLGLSVTVVSTANEQGLTEGNDSLWFGVEPGDSVVRTVEVSSESQIDQVIQVELFDFGFENGERFTDFSKPSQISEWFGFRDEQVLLPAGDSVEIDLEFSIPSSAEQLSYEGTARIVASAAAPAEANSDGSSFQAIVGGRAAIDIPFWLGIGDALSFVPEFNIVSIQGVLIEQTKYLRVFVENTGTIPIRLRGSAQFADPVFEDRIFDPFDFRIPEIGFDSSGSVDVEIDQSITEGDWNILVSASQGAIRQSKLFEQNISFSDPGSGINPLALALQIGIFLGFLALAIFGYRLIRSPRSSEKARDKRTPVIRNSLRTIKYLIFGVGNALARALLAIRSSLAKGLYSMAKAIDLNKPLTKPGQTTKPAKRATPAKAKTKASNSSKQTASTKPSAKAKSQKVVNPTSGKAPTKTSAKKPSVTSTSAKKPTTTSKAAKTAPKKSAASTKKANQK